MVNLYVNVANSNKSNNLAIPCQWQVLIQRYLTKLFWSNFTKPNPTTNPVTVSTVQHYQDNSAFHPSGVGKSTTSLHGWG